MNTLRVEDFKLIKPGQAFDPYQRIDNYGFFTDHIIANKEAFKTPGTYKIKFHYATNSSDIQAFMGDKPSRRSNFDSLKIDSLFRTVPRIELTSNEIVFRVEE
jgi:hypothetical protein